MSSILSFRRQALFKQKEGVFTICKLRKRGRLETKLSNVAVPLIVVSVSLHVTFVFRSHTFAFLTVFQGHSDGGSCNSSSIRFGKRLE